MKDDEKRLKHESFGFIRASRVQGHSKLFDSAIKNVQSQLVSTLPFIMKQFTEHMEELTNRAKSELSAHAVMLGLRNAADSISREDGDAGEPKAIKLRGEQHETFEDTLP